ncbi:sigma D regulator [Enterobacteriaceae bacterium ESL0689]|nr:sigma D regulator [Enterobacteriaceae bacterium ESL0689]
MLKQLEYRVLHSGDKYKVVDEWLHVRKHLLVAYYGLVGLKPGKSSYIRLNEKALHNFCQSLVDYLSSGHFHIYELILQEMEGNIPFLVINQLYPQLETNTQKLMDDYDSCLINVIDDDNYMRFQQVLSDIGEALEARFVLEDRLIAQAVSHRRSRIIHYPAVSIF